MLSNEVKHDLTARLFYFLAAIYGFKIIQKICSFVTANFRCEIGASQLPILILS